MPINWKKKYHPAPILERISSVRTINPQGNFSFPPFELENCLPVLHSMLAFPDGAKDLDTANLIWIGLSKVKGKLNPNSFFEAMNLELTERLATKEEDYLFLTSISLRSHDIYRKIKIEDVEINYLIDDYPTRFKSRLDLLRTDKLTSNLEHNNYCRVIAKVKAKSPTAAVNKALRAIDLQRALWCLMGNPTIQIAFGNSAFSPINIIRLGSKHTLHFPNGEPVTNTYWFEPGFKESTPFKPDKPKIFQSTSRWALRKIHLSKYGDTLSVALLRYVRALDEADSNTAFLRLWGALESLTTSGGKYDLVVDRCSVLFKDSAFHRQVLEHLREYRNSNIHAGEESEMARIHCFQLQLYFVQIIRFLLINADFFQSLNEAQSFLDLPMNKQELERQNQLIKKAQKFIK